MHLMFHSYIQHATPIIPSFIYAITELPFNQFLAPHDNFTQSNLPLLVYPCFPLVLSSNKTKHWTLSGPYPMHESPLFHGSNAFLFCSSPRCLHLREHTFKVTTSTLSLFLTQAISRCYTVFACSSKNYAYRTFH
jgi:hypothetical protein